MSIKTVRALIKSVKTTSSDVINFDFRSPRELQVYLDSVKKSVNDAEEELQKGKKLFSNATRRLEKAALPIPIIIGKKPLTEIPRIPGLPQTKQHGPYNVETVHIPNPEKLKKNFGIIADLHDKLETLEGIETQLDVMFKDVKGRATAAKSIKSMKANIMRTLKTALEFLRAVGGKKAPPLFKDVTKAIIDSVAGRLQGRYDESKLDLYVTITEDQYGITYWFNRYFVLKDIKDDAGHPWQTLYIVFTGKVDTALNLTMTVNTFTKFKAPGTFNVGMKFEGVKDGIRTLDALLLDENFKSVTQRLPLPTIPEGFGVKSLRSAVGLVEDMKFDELEHLVKIVFSQKVTEKNVNEAIEKVWTELKHTLLPKSNADMKHTPPRQTPGTVKDKRGRTVHVTKWSTEFLFTWPDPSSVAEMRLNIQKMRLMMDHWGLSDAQMRRIIDSMYY